MQEVERLETTDGTAMAGRTSDDDDDQGSSSSSSSSAVEEVEVVEGLSIENVVRRVDSVRSNDELIRVLEALLRQLLLLSDPSGDAEKEDGTAARAESGHDDEASAGGAQFRQALAAALLRRAIFASVTSRRGETSKLQQALHAVLLEGCGVSSTLFAAMEVVVAAAACGSAESATANGAAPTDGAPWFPEEALSMIALVLLRSEEHLVRLLHDLPMAEMASRAGKEAGARFPDQEEVEVEVQQQQQQQRRASFLDAWCGQVVLFGRVISNACQTYRHPLPPWAASSSSLVSSAGWEPRLVDCAIRACFHRHRRDTLYGAHSDTTIGEPGAPAAATPTVGPQPPVEVMYLRGLLRVLLSRGGGSTGADGVAVGMRRACDVQHRHRRSEQAMICRAVVNALLLDDLPNDRRPTRGRPRHRSFSSLQLAPLCRALLLMGLTNGSSPQNATKEEEEDSGSNVKEEPWEWSIIRTLLASSRDVQDRFVQQVLFASSAPLNAATTVARLLLSIESSKENDEGEESSDSENEEDDSSTDHCSPLLRQVHRVAVVWSSALSTGIQIHQQHVITLFLHESFKILSDARGSTPVEPRAPDPVPPATSGAANAAPNVDLLDALTAKDTLVTLMNGVSERLHSTDPGIRRDGMRIGQALGEHVLHQPVVFDELSPLASEPKGEVGQDHTPSPSPKGPSTSGRRIDRRRRPRCPQTDPDALYVSDSGSSCDDSAGNDAASTGGWSDDSDWDEEEYKKQRYNVDDDEDDLREVPLPLYLQDCLDMLRTSETVDGAVASHLAALQALPKLVRERPGDLADFGPLIAKQLVGMENKFQLDGFDAMVQQPLSALVAEEPLIVGMALIEDMFQDGSLYNRTLALAALNEGAWELSGNKLRDSSDENDERILYVLIPYVSAVHIVPNSLCSSPLQGQRTFGKRALVSTASGNSVSSGTRRWGRSRVGEKQQLVENKFAHIAPAWFYGLVHKFWDRSGDASLWGGHVGSLFLTYFIQTLSIIVESCGPHQPGSQLLAKDLLTLVWKFRNAEVPEVRTSVLVAVGTSLATMSHENIARFLFDDSSSPSMADLPQLLHLTSLNDNDPKCRAVAATVASTISSHVATIGL
jgi:Telomere length regulation protein